MVRDGVGILKVGPEVTFQLREGLFALDELEAEIAPLYGLTLSHFRETLEHSMLTSTPNYWEKYYHGTPEQLAFKRKYSFSDRSRYYFAQPEVVQAMEQLLKNLSSVKIPLTVLSQYLPVQYHKIRNGELANDPVAILEDKTQTVVRRYYEAMLKAKADM